MPGMETLKYVLLPEGDSIFNRSTQEAEWFQGQPGLQSEFQNSVGYTEKYCLNKYINT